MASPSALPILDMLDDTNIQLHSENFNTVLDRVGNLPFSIISINGATRTGKSFAMNYFLRHLSVASGTRGAGIGQFKWNSGRERTTTGIDLWSEPFIVKNDGRDMAILLMDTQGLLDDATSPTQNAVIFALSAFCSSVFIFNLKNNVTEDILQQINFYSDYARSVTQTPSPSNHGDGHGVGGGQCRSQFQKIIYLIRDFDMPDYPLGCYHDRNGFEPHQNSSMNFFREIFYPVDESRIHADNLFVRKKLLQTYNQMGVYLVPNPGGQFTRQKSLELIDPEFVEAMENFAKMMTSKGQLLTKRVAGEEVSGVDFKPYIQELAALCEDAKSSFPPAQTLADVMAIQQHTLAIDVARNNYREKLHAIIDASVGGILDEKLNEEHLTLKNEALRSFDDKQKLGHPSMIRKSRESLKNLIEEVHRNAQDFNRLKRSHEEQRQKDRAEFEQRLTEIQKNNEQDRAKQIKQISKKMDDNAAKNELALERQRSITAFANVVKEVVPVAGQVIQQTRRANNSTRDQEDRRGARYQERYDDPRYPEFDPRYRRPAPRYGRPYDDDDPYYDDPDERLAVRRPPRFGDEGRPRLPIMVDEDYLPSSIRTVLAIGPGSSSSSAHVTRPQDSRLCMGDDGNTADSSKMNDSNGGGNDSAAKDKAKD